MTFLKKDEHGKWDEIFRLVYALHEGLDDLIDPSRDYTLEVDNGNGDLPSVYEFIQLEPQGKDIVFLDDPYNGSVEVGRISTIGGVRLIDLCMLYERATFWTLDGVSYKLWSNPCDMGD